MEARGTLKVLIGSVTLNNQLELVPTMKVIKVFHGATMIKAKEISADITSKAAYKSIDIVCTWQADEIVVS